MADIDELAAKLTEAQRWAVMRCEQDGNGAHFYQIDGLVRLGLMSLQPIPEFQGMYAYRLNELGVALRSYLKDQSHAD